MTGELGFVCRAGDELRDVCDDVADIDTDGEGYESRAADGAREVVRVRRDELESTVGVRERARPRDSSSVDRLDIGGIGGRPSEYILEARRFDKSSVEREKALRDVYSSCGQSRFS